MCRLAPRVAGGVWPANPFISRKFLCKTVAVAEQKQCSVVFYNDRGGCSTSFIDIQDRERIPEKMIRLDSLFQSKPGGESLTAKLSDNYFHSKNNIRNNGIRYQSRARWLIIAMKKWGSPVCREITSIQKSLQKEINRFLCCPRRPFVPSYGVTRN